MNFYRWQNQPVSSFLFPILGGVIVMLVLTLLAHQSVVIAKLNEWKLIPQPEHFTELYLDDHSNLLDNLLKKVTRGEKLSFSFTVYNHEGRDMTYPYQVYITDEYAGKTIVDAGTIRVSANAAISVPESYIFRATHNSATVNIMLLEQNQSLHFSALNRD